MLCLMLEFKAEYFTETNQPEILHYYSQWEKTFIQVTQD